MKRSSSKCLLQNKRPRNNSELENIQAQLAGSQSFFIFFLFPSLPSPLMRSPGKAKMQGRGCVEKPTLFRLPGSQLPVLCSAGRIFSLGHPTRPPGVFSVWCSGFNRTFAKTCKFNGSRSIFLIKRKRVEPLNH